MKNEDHILAIVKVIFDTQPSIAEHIITRKGEMFLERTNKIN
jgi:hypothetical protein